MSDVEMVAIPQRVAVGLILFLEGFAWTPKELKVVGLLTDELQSVVTYDAVETARWGIPQEPIGVAV